MEVNKKRVNLLKDSTQLGPLDFCVNTEFPLEISR
jgi:hypothetical protein